MTVFLPESHRQMLEIECIGFQQGIFRTDLSGIMSIGSTVDRILFQIIMCCHQLLKTDSVIELDCIQR